jgi:molybdopterin molybdotransferase
MISVKEAKQIIRDNTGHLEPVRISLHKAAHHAIAEDVFSLVDIPGFNQSSMDGYALKHQSNGSNTRSLMKGEIPAGSDSPPTLLPDQAIRIFTGAMVPTGADTVIMQEKVNVENQEILILDEQLQRGSNVRLKGSDIKEGDLALAKGSLLTPGAIGFLAGTGIAEVAVFPMPDVTIIITGNELQEPGKPLLPGQVYESNSLTLSAALSQLQIKSVGLKHIDDDLEHLVIVLQEALRQSDLVLLTGGISVGDYDFVAEAATRCGVNKKFHKVKQRPGKPLYFGKKADKIIFGLPGNPSSVLTCFYEYVIPAIENMTLRKNTLDVSYMPLRKPYKKQTGLTHFLKGWYDNEKVLVLDAQESYRLSSFAKANCLVCLEEDKEYQEGEIVEVHRLPN